MKEQKEILITELDRLASVIRTVKPFGNSAHVTIPKEYMGKEVLILIR